MNTPIHISRQGQQLGPFPKRQVQEMLNSGMLSSNDLYWKEGNTGWEPIGSAFRRTTLPPGDYGERLPSVQANLTAVHPGFWLRFAAHFIDWILANIIGFSAGFVLGFAMGVAGETDEKVLNFMGSIVGVVGVWLYYALFESSSKQATPGKLACGFVVTDMNGNRISFGRATGRYFGKIISALILFIGFIMCAFTERKQCLHDMLAGCLMYKKNG
jgi:uncharacterized RDD family membrane protein YckC